MRRSLFSTLMLLLGVILLSICYWYAYQGIISYSLWWLGLLFAFAAVLISLTGKSNNAKTAVVFLFAFAAVLYLPLYLKSPQYLSFQDELIHYQTSSLIVETGRINAPHTITPLGQYYPGFSLLRSVLSMVSGLSLEGAGRASVLITHSLVLVFIFLSLYLVSKNILLSGMGSLLYASCPSFAFDSYSSYESLAVGLFFILFYLLILKDHKNNIGIALLLIIVTFSLAVTHHVTSFMFLVLISLIILAKLFSQKDKENKYIIISMIASVCILGWLIYNSEGAMYYLSGIFSARIKSFLEMILQFEQPRQFFRASSLPAYEVFLDNYLYPPAILLTAGAGIYSFLKKREGSYFYYVLIIWSAIYFLTWPLVPSAGAEMAYRSWATLFIGAAFWAGVGIARLYNEGKPIIKMASIIALLVIFVGGTSIGSDDERRFPVTTRASGEGAITLDVKYASDWFGDNFGVYNKVIGDKTVQFLFGFYGRQYVTTESAWRIFYPKEADKKVLDEVIKYDAVVIDERITQLLSRGYSYFHAYRTVAGYPLYGYELPLPEECVDKFKDIKTLGQIYSNGNINILGNIHG